MLSELIHKHKLSDMFVVAVICLVLSLAKCQLNTRSAVKYHYICPNNFLPLGRKCYYFSEKNSTWGESHYECLSLNSTLATFTKPRQEVLVRHYLNRNKKGIGNQKYWIDGKNDWKQNQWKWASSGQALQFDAFANPEKKQQNYEWHCIVIDPAVQNKWNALKCIEKNRYVCETYTNAYVEFKLYNRKTKRKMDISKCTSGEVLTEHQERKCLKLLRNSNKNEANEIYPSEPGFMIQRPVPTKSSKTTVSYICPQNMVSLGSKCYLFSKEMANWSDAHYNCVKNNTNLALIKTRSQDHNLRRFLNGFMDKQERWIGGMYDWKSGKWKWALTGEPVKYKGFAKNVLKNKRRESLTWHTIIMDPELNNQWNIRRQMEKKHYICQTRAKVVKKFPTRPKATIMIATE